MKEGNEGGGKERRKQMEGSKIGRKVVKWIKSKSACLFWQMIFLKKEKKSSGNLEVAICLFKCVNVLLRDLFFLS